MRNLERELEWVRGEREEERASMSQERRELNSRLSQAESATTRQKSVSKDELKKVARERSQLSERCKVRSPGCHQIPVDFVYALPQADLLLSFCMGTRPFTWEFLKKLNELIYHAVYMDCTQSTREEMSK